MAGSYNHVVDNDGNLGSNEHVVSMLENGGDVFEAVEEMYGMIWFLAGTTAMTLEDDETEQINLAKDLVEKARQNYTEGLERSNFIHRLSPDQRRD